MTRCRSYIRGLAVCVTVLLLVSGVVMIGVGFSSGDGNTPVAELFDQLSSSDGLLVLQVFGPLTVILSLMGICAATLDLKLLLLVFSVLALVEFVALMVVAAPLVQVEAQMDGAVDELFLNVTPLHRADPYIQRELNKLQLSDSCCGLRSSEDWENELPVSCFCTPSVGRPASEQISDHRCVMAKRNHQPGQPTPGTLWVHAKPCGPILKNYLSFPIKLRIGIISAFATITMAAIALCLALALEEYWTKPPVEVRVDDFNRVTYEPKPSLT
ncbi:23 kDa integral membrane protein-like [Takifugu flavidus]|uniref:23 kDa integral membrane protein-like n=1 Tax=Takifugu flavidus TaxID=433684 RepID=UPI0025447B91|nr:23 kDa integral membrane protein-like [Takifugu flavidus]